MSKPTPRPRTERRAEVVAFKANAMAALSVAELQGFAEKLTSPRAPGLKNTNRRCGPLPGWKRPGR